MNGAKCLVKKDIAESGKKMRSPKDKLALCGIGKNRFKLEDLVVNSNQLVRIRTSDPLFKKNTIKLRPKRIEGVHRNG